MRKKLHSLALALRHRTNILKLRTGCVRLLGPVIMAQLASASSCPLPSPNIVLKQIVIFLFRHQMQI